MATQKKTHLLYQSKAGDMLCQRQPGLCAGIGRMNIVCPHCWAQTWLGGAGGLCCNKGVLQSPLPAGPLQPLYHLPHGLATVANKFRFGIRSYKSVLHMAPSAAGVQLFGPIVSRQWPSVPQDFFNTGCALEATVEGEARRQWRGERGTNDAPRRPCL